MGKYLFTFVLALSATILTAILKHVTTTYAPLASFFLFLIVAISAIKKNKSSPVKSLYLLFLSLVIINLPYPGRLLLYIGIINLTMAGMGLLCGYAIAGTRLSSPLKASAFLCCLSICIWYIVSGSVYRDQYVSFGNLTGKTAVRLDKNWYADLTGSDTERDCMYADKIILLFFRQVSRTTDSIQFRKPEMLYNYYKNNTRVIILAVNIPTQQDASPTELNKGRDSTKYTFPSIAGDMTMIKKFHISVFPAAVLVKGNHIRFIGDIRLSENALFWLLREP